MNQSMVAALLDHSDPSVAALAARELWVRGPQAGVDPLVSPRGAALLAGPDDPSRDPYRKWTGAHWRLLSLTELGVHTVSVTFEPLVEEVSVWLARSLRREPVRVGGLARAHASVQGNAVGALSRLGRHADPRVAAAADALVRWQWPDGGWNCDTKASGRRSSFHETLGAMWGLFEYGRAASDDQALYAAHAAADLVLDHLVLYRSDRDQAIRPQWLKLAYPWYWHYGLLSAMVVLDRMGMGDDPRADAAKQLLAEKRRADGWWATEHQWWKGPGSRIAPEVIDWPSVGEPNPFVTIHALRILEPRRY